MRTLRGIAVLAALTGACAASPEHAGAPGGQAQCGADIDAEIWAAPTFTPFHVRPAIIDEAWFRRQLQSRIAEAEASSRSLHSFEAWILVAPDGCTEKVVLEGSSGSPELDAAVRRQWSQAEWTRPLLRWRGGMRERAVPAWIKEEIAVERQLQAEP